jgi:hypothetical protein
VRRHVVGIAALASTAAGPGFCSPARAVAARTNLLSLHWAERRPDLASLEGGITASPNVSDDGWRRP